MNQRSMLPTHTQTRSRLSRCQARPEVSPLSAPQASKRAKDQNAKTTTAITLEAECEASYRPARIPRPLRLPAGHFFVGTGKGTGFQNSSLIVDNSGFAPNLTNDRFPGTGHSERGQHGLSLISGNISAIPEPDERTLAAYSLQVMKNDGVVGPVKTKLFAGQSPIKHVIYIIKENRTYDQFFGDLPASGDGRAADGDPQLAIFGAGDAAKFQGATAQNI